MNEVKQLVARQALVKEVKAVTDVAVTVTFSQELIGYGTPIGERQAAIVALGRNLGGKSAGCTPPKDAIFRDGLHDRNAVIVRFAKRLQTRAIAHEFSLAVRNLDFVLAVATENLRSMMVYVFPDDPEYEMV